ncbi:hypothetical protein ACFV24_27040 [Nocardia fluminea]|uniref:hypothetical protein n=1 Tax=Nocardia fluminea TaxID=134984 RepID=UPI00366A748F
MDETTNVAGAQVPAPALATRNRPRVAPPARRRLRTFAFDPMSTRLSGRLLTIDLPYERLHPGPDGEHVQVVDYDASRRQWYEAVDLDDPYLLAQDGFRPVESDPRTHQQVVYAVAMSVLERFERFMGRRFRWRGRGRLRLVPHAFEGRNAFFSAEPTGVLFGYYRADAHDPGANLPGQVIFTCLSGDIVAHEVTHAIVHRIRRYYNESTNVDVYAWHEAAADLVALFQHFVHREVIYEAIASTSGDLRKSSGLLELAQEFGESTGRGAALRSAIATDPAPEHFQAAKEPHARGACFVAGVFDAYLTAYQAAIADLLRIATGGTGVLPAGRLHPDLVSRITDEAVKTADRLLGMVVRSFDYLPVIDVTFGDVLRAIVTADRQLFPEDRLHLRSDVVEALRRRGIRPENVTSLTEEALAWEMPDGLNLACGEHAVDLSGLMLSASKDLDLGRTCSEPSVMPDDEAGDTKALPPLRPAVRAVAGKLTEWARYHAVALGLDPACEVHLNGAHVAYRIAGDRQPRPEIVIQFTQRRPDLEDARLEESQRPAIRAGTTVVAGADGRVKHVIAKPLPLTDPSILSPPADDHPARILHDAGTERLAKMRDWFQHLEDEDALTAWTTTHAIHRLDFAAIHSDTGG